MSHALACVTPGYAVLANDTRVRDHHPISRGLLRVHDDGRKLVRVTGGWLSGAARCGLVEWTAHYLLKGERIDEPTLRERLAEIVPLHERLGFPGVFVIQRDADGFACYYIDLAARTVSRRAGFAFDGANPFTDGDDAKAAQCNRLSLDLQHEYAEPPPLPELVRRLGRHYAEVYAVCGPDGTVSDAVDFGILLPDENGGVVQHRLGPRAASDVADLPDAAMASLLEPITPERTCSPAV